MTIKQNAAIALTPAFNRIDNLRHRKAAMNLNPYIHDEPTLLPAGAQSLLIYTTMLWNFFCCFCSRQILTVYSHTRNGKFPAVQRVFRSFP